MEVDGRVYGGIRRRVKSFRKEDGRSPLPDDIKKDIVSLLRKGAGSQQVAEGCGVSNGTITKLKREAGLEVQKRVSAKAKAKAATAASTVAPAATEVAPGIMMADAVPDTTLSVRPGVMTFKVKFGNGREAEVFGTPQDLQVLIANLPSPN